MKRGAAATVIALALLVAACGKDQPPITDAAAARLRTEIASARAATAAGQYASAATLLDRTSATVGDLESRGELSSARARDVTVAIDATRRALDAFTASPTPTTTKTTDTTAPVRKKHGKPGHAKNDKGDESDGGDGNGE